MIDYSKEHWEELLATVIDRIGAARFVEMASYALEQRGYTQTSLRVGKVQFIAAAEANLHPNDRGSSYSDER